MAFLTTIPVPLDEGEASDANLADSRFAYPVVGAVIGIFLAALSMLLAQTAATPAITALLLILTSVILTGGLHLDGLADTADGLFLAGDAPRRLDIMHDPRLGSFGVVALILVFLGKYAALEALTGSPRAWAILSAAIVGRALVLVSAGLADYPRPDGTGRVLVHSTTVQDASWAAIVCLIVGGLAGRGAGVLASTLALILTWGITQLARVRLGGVTGDTLGAVVESGELVFLLVLAMLERWLL
jgi:adenosylcobinamide-GDP ribazoletransferase